MLRWNIYIYEYTWNIWKVSEGLKSIFSVQNIIKIDSKEVNKDY